MNSMKTFFDNYSRLYKVPFIAGYFRGNHKWIIPELEKSPVKSLLDIGCGSGDLIAALAIKHPNWEIYGIDISDSMILQAKEKVASLQLAVGNAHNLPYSDNMFDIVINTISFHHYEHSLQALNEMYRVLKPGGKLVLLDSIKNPRCISILPWYWDFAEKANAIRNTCLKKNLKCYLGRLLFHLSASKGSTNFGPSFIYYVLHTNKQYIIKK